MDLGNLEELKNLINEEIELYKGLKSLFEDKRLALVSNNVPSLLEVDDKILTCIEAIKSAVNHRRTIAKLSGNSNLNMSEMISLARGFSPELADELSQSKDKINSLLAEIAQTERIIKELLHHGMKLVTKTLNMITNSASIAGDYDRSGKNITTEIGQISSVVEEV